MRATDLRVSLMVVAHPAQVTDLVEKFQNLYRELAAGRYLVAKLARTGSAVALGDAARDVGKLGDRRRQKEVVCARPAPRHRCAQRSSADAALRLPGCRCRAQCHAREADRLRSSSRGLMPPSARAGPCPGSPCAPQARNEPRRCNDACPSSSSISSRTRRCRARARPCAAPLLVNSGHFGSFRCASPMAVTTSLRKRCQCSAATATPAATCAPLIDQLTQLIVTQVPARRQTRHSYRLAIEPGSQRFGRRPPRSTASN